MGLIHVSKFIYIRSVDELSDHHVPVNLAHEFDFLGIDLLAGAKTISFRDDTCDAIFCASGILLEHHIGFIVVFQVAICSHRGLR